MNSSAAQGAGTGSDGYVVAVVGATGLVGRTMISILVEHRFQYKKRLRMLLLASTLRSLAQGPT
jgi:hypothetical protein